MNQINQIMVEQGITQAELARRMDTDPSSVSNMLKLKASPQFTTVVEMLQALNCAIEIRQPHALTGSP